MRVSRQCGPSLCKRPYTSIKHCFTQLLHSPPRLALPRLFFLCGGSVVRSPEARRRALVSLKLEKWLSQRVAEGPLKFSSFSEGYLK